LSTEKDNLEVLRLELQGLINLKAKCESNLKGEDNVIKAEKDLKGLEPIILAQIKTLQELQVQKEGLDGIASGRAGIDNCKLILTDLETKIPTLEAKVKEARNLSEENA